MPPIVEAPREKFATKRAGKSWAPMSALRATFSPSPKVTKWFRHATRAPEASTPPFR